MNSRAYFFSFYIFSITYILSFLRSSSYLIVLLRWRYTPNDEATCYVDVCLTNDESQHMYQDGYTT